jgi:membrane-bound ClpP family serine protease
MWSKITLKDQLNSEMGYNSINMTYMMLVGSKGVALTDMRPVGNVKIDEREYSAVSKGKWITKGDPIEVESVDGTKILVKKI